MVTDAAPAYSTGWVARRVGVSPATLRTWDRRYGIGPTGRTDGGHRRYLPHELARLERMRRLVLAGMPTAEAARASADPHAAPPARPARGGRSVGARRVDPHERRLADAALAFDQPVVEPMLADALRRRGVASTWTQLIIPVLEGMGERYVRRGGCLAAEHLFAGCVLTALTAVVTARRQWDGYPPVLLACPDREQHTLPLHALAAALAEVGCPSRVLGASVPMDALASAARRITPRAVFIWAQTSATACPADLEALPPRRPPIPVVVGGPGWRATTLPGSVVRVDSLVAAVEAVSVGLAAPAGR